MNRTLVTLCAAGFACMAGAAPPAAISTKTRTSAAVAERVLNAEAEARQREIETRRKVLESESPKVQAEFAVMMEELDASQAKAQPASGTTTPAQ